jgi:CRP/FNR family transcriptional regulator, cyclic AMP receptor protein
MRKILYLLAVLNDSDVDWLMSNGKRRDFEEGSVVINAGAPVSDIFIVLDGELSVRPIDMSDQEIARLYPGEVIGELSFLDSRPPNANVVAVTHSGLIAVSRSALEAKLQRDTGFASRLYRALGIFLATRLRQTMSRLGFGSPEEASLNEHEDAEDELDPELLDRIAIAGQYFDMLQEGFRRGS